ncbi:MAG: DEAD/DEAH box helicase [Rickettsiales bacterium]|nr:DEAD/DEAH box helicase [Rickettsiales bacterium]
MTNFQNLNLNPKILSALESKGYNTPTPIQLQAIPHLLEKKDLLGIAQTGTGKTAAFSLPIIHNLFDSNISVKSGGVRALILTPTRELASQIAENIDAYGKDLNLRHCVIFGGVSEKPQINSLQRGVDILIATPGRLLDLATQGYIRFMQLEILVLDEADRMLDMGFINDIKKIIARIPERRQTLFFSATMPKTIADLADSILKDPIKIEVTPQSTTVERIDQKINFVERGNKLALLKRILKQDDAKSVLVFSKTKHGANRVEEFLEKNSISVAAIHGNKSQSAREKALASFRDGKVQVLIATDIAARGIDVPSISHVINYDIPMDPESYVHRIGRTARAGRQGVAISFCDPSEIKLLQAVEKTIKFKIPVDETHEFHGVAAPISNHIDREDREFSSHPRRSFNRNQQRSGSSSRSNHQTRTSSNSRNNDGDKNYSKSRDNSNRFSNSSSGSRSNSMRDDNRADNRRSNNSNYTKRPHSAIPQDDRKSGILSFITGFGKKKNDYQSRSKPRSTNEGNMFRVNEKESSGFGFGWLKGNKKSDSSVSKTRGESRFNDDNSGRARSTNYKKSNFTSQSSTNSRGFTNSANRGSRTSFNSGNSRNRNNSNNRSANNSPRQSW